MNHNPTAATRWIDPGHRLEEIADHRGHILGLDFWKVATLTMTIGLLTLSHIPGWSRLVVIYGYVITYLFVLYVLANRLVRVIVLPEVIAYFSWVLWSLGGIAVAADAQLFYRGLQVAIQTGALLLLVAALTIIRRTWDVNVAGIMVGGIIIVLSTLQAEPFVDPHGVRVAGVVGNPNDFAYHLLFLVFAAFYFWRKDQSVYTKIFYSALSLSATAGIIFSASRKAFLALLVFILVWILYRFSETIGKKLRYILAIVFLIVGIYLLIDLVIMPRTYIGQRTAQIKWLTSDFERRWSLYETGIQLVKDNPITGVGLGNYRIFSDREGAAHSEYVDITSTTGVIGLLLYFSLYIILWRRLNYIHGQITHPVVLRNIRLFKAMILTILFMGLGRELVDSEITWVFLGTVVGWSWMIEGSLKEKTEAFNS